MQQTPAPAAPAPANPSANGAPPPAADMPPDLVAARKAWGLPVPGDKPKGEEAKPAEQAPAAKPAEDKPTSQKPGESEGEFALRLAREARARSKAEADVKALRAELEAAQTEAATPKSVKAKWAAGQHVEAIQEMFGDDLPEDLFLKLASRNPEKKVLTEEDVETLVQARLEQRDKGLKDKEEQAAKSDQETIDKFEVGKVEEIDQLYQANVQDFPALTAFPVPGERVRELYREGTIANGGTPPEGLERLILEFLELEATEKVKGLPFVKALQTPAPAAGGAPTPAAQPARTFTRDDRQGATTAAPPPEPKNAAERREQQRKDDEAFLAELRRRQAAGEPGYR